MATAKILILKFILQWENDIGYYGNKFFSYLLYNSF